MTREAVPRRRGFSLLELLVVIGVIALLTALVLPAVQAAREAARKAQCRNNLKQLALGTLNHESTYGRLPSNGWGYRWVGEPDRGTGRDQPGGWAYNLLAFVEQEPLRSLGKGEPEPAKRKSLARLTETPISLFRCPSRPGSPLLPAASPVLNGPFNALFTMQVAKTDYACCEGDFVTLTREGPSSLADAETYADWRDTTKATGICFQRSEVRLAQVTDGTSNTYFVGEKYVSTRYYETEEDRGYDQNLYTGVDWDINRWVLLPPLRDGDEYDPRSFGGPHEGGCHMAFCDGSVRSVSYMIDDETHRRLGNRRDDQPVEAP